MAELTDTEKLAVVYDTVLRLAKVLDDNGRPGLVSRVTILETIGESKAAVHTRLLTYTALVISIGSFLVGRFIP